MNPRELSLGWIGTGLMGTPMASRLLAAGHRVTVWNRTLEKTQGLAAQGAHVAHTPAEVAARADVVILMLSDGPAVREVLFDRGLVEALRQHQIVVDMGSIAPDVARDHGRQLSPRGVPYLDAPVSGGTRGAAEGTLAIMVGGTVEAFEKVQPVLTLLGRPTLIGPSGSGQLAKLANQIIVAVTIGAVAEALLLASAGGADPGKVREALAGGFADSAILRLHGERMLKRSWNPGGTMQNQLKDLKTAHDLSSQLKLHLPMLEQALELYHGAVIAGFAHFDHSALLLELERLNPGLRRIDRHGEIPGNT